MLLPTTGMTAKCLSVEGLTENMTLFFSERMKLTLRKLSISANGEADGVVCPYSGAMFIVLP